MATAPRESKEVGPQVREREIKDPEIQAIVDLIEAKLAKTGTSSHGYAVLEMCLQKICNLFGEVIDIT